ncbi:hypothetical protein KDW_50510 [Dictyobacter vulcani]|uniref:Uncharacterized protein n=2 Tax=Dictyobacter vulcani TaxID=2607529 RepID=A0A5J4KXN1_9CHLR|nr:hypothetical protein KDW_50510 [Dictyobacter vulcani]
MVFNQVEQTTDMKFGQTVQQRVVLVTRMQQPETRGRMYKKGMMVGSTVKGLY